MIFSLNLKKFLLLVGDILILYLSLFLALLVRRSFIFQGGEWQQVAPCFTLIFILWIIIHYIAGLYDLGSARNNLIFYSILAKILLLDAVLAIVFFYLIPNLAVTPKTILFLELGFFAFLFYLWRNFFNFALKSSTFIREAVIVGLNAQAIDLARKIRVNPQFGYHLKAFFSTGGLDDAEIEKIAAEFQDVDVIKELSALEELIQKKSVRTIIAAVDPHQIPNLIQTLYRYLHFKINLVDLTSFYETFSRKISVSLISQIWFLENILEGERDLYEFFKRALDIAGAIILGIITFPFMPFLVLAIKLNSSGPVFFQQIRTGKDNKDFLAIKLRSMVDQAEKNGPQWAEKNDARVTRVGRFLRKTRLDEIPQLINILKGEMSFVGPRPERPEFVSQLQEQIPFYNIRHIVKPGLTGWAQINFPYGSSVGDAIEKLQYDLFYIKNRSFILDMGIILKTINIISRREGR